MLYRCYFVQWHPPEALSRLFNLSAHARTAVLTLEESRSERARALMGFRGPYLPQTWSNIQCIIFEHHFAHQAMKYSNGIVDYFDLFTWISREDVCFPPLWHPDHKNCSKSFPRPAQLSILPAFLGVSAKHLPIRQPQLHWFPWDSPEIPWVLKMSAIEGSATTNQTGRASDWSQWSGHRPASPIWSHGCHSEAIDVGTQQAAKTCWKWHDQIFKPFQLDLYTHTWTLFEVLQLPTTARSCGCQAAPPKTGQKSRDQSSSPGISMHGVILPLSQVATVWYSTPGCGNPEIHVDTTRNLVFSPEYQGPWRE